MENAILYFYDINVKNSEKLKYSEGLSFFYNGYKYLYIKYFRKSENIIELVKISNIMYENNVDVYTFVETKFKDYFSIYENNNYVLLRVNNLSYFSNVNINDILLFNNSYFINNSSAYQIEGWKNIWIKNIDKLENLLSDIGDDFGTIQDSCDYFIGLAECAISFLDNVTNINFVNLCVSHDRIENETFFNPLNFLVDYYIRDAAEYVKLSLLKFENPIDHIEELINKNYFNYDSCVLFFCRLLYPTYFFDKVYLVLNGVLTEESIKKIVDNIDFYRNILFQINILFEKYYNLPIIHWLK